jgi:hypothetical protein
MRSGEVVYTNSIEVRNRPGPKPELRATFKAPKDKSFVFLCIGAVGEPLNEQQLKEVLASWGWQKIPEKKARASKPKANPARPPDQTGNERIGG